MKYFFDTEFIEGFHKPFLGKRRHFIDLVSIGIVAEDGREYYAISNEFDESKADDWVRENVLSKLPPKVSKWYMSESHSIIWRTKYKKSELYKSNKQIASEIYRFLFPFPISSFFQTPELWGYNSAHNWVLFCSLFGRVNNLPFGFPMYCNNLKQVIDKKGLDKGWENRYCPTPDDPYNALSGALWNKMLYDEIFRTETGPRPPQKPPRTDMPPSKRGGL